MVFMKRTKKRLAQVPLTSQGKTPMAREEEPDWSEFNEAAGALVAHLEERTLPFSKYLASLVHEAHWKEANMEKFFTVEDAEKLVSQLTNLIAMQNQCVECMEKNIAENKANLAMRFCT
jgi:hypothetical protein